MNTTQYGWVSPETARLLARIPRVTFEQPRNDRRKFSRLRSGGMMRFNLGKVLELSRGGLRVLSTRQLNGERVAELSTDDEGLQVPAKVIWCERVGFGQHITGLEFPTATPELAHQLTAFANL